jgi:hypothetical protein
MELSRENLAKILPKDAVDTIFGLFERTRRAATGTEPQQSTPPTVIVGTSGPRTVAWDNVVDKPGSFPPSGHSHPYISVETDPTVPSVVKAITERDIARWNNPPGTIHEIPSLLEAGVNWVADTARDMWDSVEAPLCFRWDVVVERYKTLEYLHSFFPAGSAAVGRFAIWGCEDLGQAGARKLVDEPLFEGGFSSFAPVDISSFATLTVCMDPGVVGTPQPIGQSLFTENNNVSPYLPCAWLVNHVPGAAFGTTPPYMVLGRPPWAGVVRWMKLGVR